MIILRDTYKIPVYMYITHTTFLIPSVFQWFWTCEVPAYITLWGMQYCTNNQKLKTLQVLLLFFFCWEKRIYTIWYI